MRSYFALLGGAVAAAMIACVFPSFDSLMGSVPSEAGATDTNTSDAGQAFVCGPQHYFCTGFDEPDALARWSKTLLNDGGLSIVNADDLSPPSSLLASLTGPNQSAQLQEFLPLPTSLTIQFSMRLKPGTCSVSTGYRQFVKAGEPNDYGIILKLDATGFFISIEGKDGSGAVVVDNRRLTAPLPCDVWTTLVFAVGFSKTTGSVKLTVDGVTQVDAENVNTLAYADNASMTLGLYAQGDTSTTVSAYFDNVIIDAH